MCRTTAYKTRTCNHRWLTITTRCSPGFGFTNTPIHEFKCPKTLTGAPKFQIAPADTCPICYKKGQYDGNTTRLVETTSGVCGSRNQGMMMGASMMGGPYAGEYAGGGQYIGGGSTIPENYHRLTPYQQAFAQNEQAKEAARWQYYPHKPYKYVYGYQGSSGCTIM